MEHKIKDFIFYTKDGKSVTLTSRRYSEQIEQVLENRFGADNLVRLASTNKMEHPIRFSEAKEDLPKLLTGSDIDKVDFGYDFDVIVEAYLFFIHYKQNATLRQLEQYKETLASNIETIQKLLSSIPGNISVMQNSGTTPNKP